MTVSGQRRRSPARSALDRPAPKTCQSCGRAFSWRKKWERNWDEVRYCSDACRTRKLKTVDEKLEAIIVDLLDKRVDHGSICPSEAARIAADNGEDWRPLMEPARAAARRLVNAGQLEITQGGNVVDPNTARGPIRLRRPRHG